MRPIALRCGLAAVLLGILAATAGCAGARGHAERPVWAPGPPAQDAPLEVVHARIVDFGHDFTRFGDELGFSAIRKRMSKLDGIWQQTGDPVVESGVEVDGDPATSGCAVYDPFSLTEPLSPRVPWYDTEATTPHFYGGTLLLFANAQDGGFTEHGINPDHDGPPHEPRDNWALHMVRSRPESPWRGCAVWLWKKEDFLNGGAEGRVSFDEQSSLALYFQRYWMGWEGCRWVVQDGDQFYISEQTFAGAGPTGQGQQHILNPTRTRWAPYYPEAPRDIRFDSKGAEFREHNFTDVRAVGWYLFKDQLDARVAGCKWYAFEVDAVVQRPVRPSRTLNMRLVEPTVEKAGPNAPQVPAFYISNCEVPYVVWKRIFRWARSNTFVRDPRGFIFDRDGDMGSMDYASEAQGQGLVPHAPDEPVTDVTLHDVAAWCNALSLRESLTPCYYTDPQFKQPFHYVRLSPGWQREPEHKLYVKWDADGYRLPTPSEWLSALGRQRPDAATAWTGANSENRTQPVGRKPGNTNGLHDMIGNVWEMVWTAGDLLDPAQDPTLTMLGGDFRYPADPESASASPYGDIPYQGSYNIGFRVVRRRAGLPAPPAAVAIPGSEERQPPRWTVKAGQRTHAIRRPDEAPQSPLDLVQAPGGSYRRQGNKETVIAPFRIGRHEVTYAAWKTVYDWAVVNGYTFNNDGDMGSMDYWGPAVPHSPDEPVTDVTWHDCLVWCNALSEHARLLRRPEQADGLQGGVPLPSVDAAVVRTARGRGPGSGRDCCHLEKSLHAVGRRRLPAADHVRA